ncbi:MAG: hypothetical protein JXR96_20570 [Deltaproteobacteria bacterium]|nr:hypothetical protein [Deltaproteobacteria bacterium]
MRAWILAALAAQIVCPDRAEAGTGRIERLIAEMSPAQKAGQLAMVSFEGRALSDAQRDFVLGTRPGGVLLFRSNCGSPAEMAHLTGSLQRLATGEIGGPGLLVAIDMEGGSVRRFSPGGAFTRFPPAIMIGATDDPDMAARVGRAMAEELKAVGINMNLAPVADLETRRANRVLRGRSFGSRPARAASMVAAFVWASQRAGVLACAKHFPGHGDTAVDSHRGLPVLHLDRQALARRELVPFRRAIEAGAEAIMAAHIWLPAIEPQEGRPASLSAPALAGLLRGELGHGRLVLTDALGMAAVRSGHTLDRAARLAIAAGADLLVFGEAIPIREQAAVVEELARAIRSGEIPARRVDRSLRRILAAKARFGLLRPAPVDPRRARARLESEAHRRLVERVFARAVTLVRNERGLLPVRPGRPAILVHFERQRALADALERALPIVERVALSRACGPAERERAARACESAAVCLVLTRNAVSDSAQAELVRSLPPERCAVVALGSPYDLLVFPQVAAFAAAYMPIPEAGAVLADVLRGRRRARGVLPVPLDDLYPAGAGLRGPISRSGSR